MCKENGPGGSGALGTNFLILFNKKLHGRGMQDPEFQKLETLRFKGANTFFKQKTAQTLRFKGANTFYN